MSKKTKPGTSASRSRKRIQRGKKRPSNPATPGAGASNPSKAISASISSMRWKPISGSRVIHRVEGALRDTDMRRVNFISVYDAMLNAYGAIKKLPRKTIKKIDPLRSIGLSFDGAFDSIYALMQNAIPDKCVINVEERWNNKGRIEGYNVVIYRELPFESQYWHILEIGPTILKLKESNRKLHSIFCQFLKTLYETTGIDLWYTGMDYALDYIREYYENELDAETDQDQAKEIYSVLREYDSGDAFTSAKSINKAKVIKTVLLRKLVAHQRCGPIKDLILAGCDFIDLGHRISEFCYNPFGEDMTYLSFDQQVIMLWNREDSLSDEHGQYLDSLAQEGIQDPTACYFVNPKSKVDLDAFQAKFSWPTELEKFFNLAINKLEKFNHERPDTKTADKIRA